MPRFFIKYGISDDDDTLMISGNDARHIRDVLRMKPGNNITICDSGSTEYFCEIISLDGDVVKASVISRYKSENEPFFDIVVYQGLPKSDKMEAIIQKCVELGAARLVPVNCMRSIARLGDARDIEKKISRWNKIAYEAAKQCNRGRIPEVADPVSFTEAIGQMTEADIVFLPWEMEKETTLRDVFETVDNNGIREERPTLAFMIGPEGGFDADEAAYARSRGIRTVSLGKRILRTETAAPAILAILMYEFEL